MSFLFVLLITSLLEFIGMPNGAAWQAAESQGSMSPPPDHRQTHPPTETGRRPPSAVRVNGACPRPGPSSAIPEPADLRSKNGVLIVDFAFRSEVDIHGRTRYCYIYHDGTESPNLRLNPGDLLILRLKNELTLTVLPNSASTPLRPAMQMISRSTPKLISTAPVPSASASNGKNAASLADNSCMGALMDATSTNLHFHGLTVPPACHQDDVLHTTIQPTDAPFEYRIPIPPDQPPGLYWYHPHLHSFTRAQVVGGASGALIIEGMERANSQVAGLPERVVVIRDEDLLNPGAPASANITAPSATLDRDGDARNTGSGSGTPAKDLSLNFVSVPYPAYEPATIRMRPSERQFWRIVNASSITYLNLQLLFAGKPQALGVVAVDGTPVNENGLGGNYALWQSHLGVPPGGRIEFILKAPPEGTLATLITRSVNTGPAGENDPTRPLLTIVTSQEALEPQSSLPATTAQSAQPARLPWLGKVTPVRTRKLYFSEKPQNSSDSNGPTNFYLTVEGQTPAVFDAHSLVPNIVVHQGDVEDWIIENRSQEVHDFHIHQVHFLMLEWFGIPINEPFLRDTIPVPFWDGKAAQYPTVKLRMDFRSANAVGLFPFHCHLLEHEDGGMMGLIRVEPAQTPP